MSSAPPNKPTGNETQVIDLSEVELLVAQHTESARQLEAGAAGAPPSDRSIPPPLPPSARASALPPSLPAMAPVAPPSRGNGFYVIAILVFLVVGIGGGLAVAKTLGKPAPAPPEPTHAPVAAASSAPPSGGGGAAVITIPTVEMNDTDAGK